MSNCRAVHHHHVTIETNLRSDDIAHFAYHSRVNMQNEWDLNETETLSRRIDARIWRCVGIFSAFGRWRLLLCLVYYNLMFWHSLTHVVSFYFLRRLPTSTKETFIWFFTIIVCVESVWATQIVTTAEQCAVSFLVEWTWYQRVGHRDGRPFVLHFAATLKRSQSIRMQNYSKCILLLSS